MQTEMRDDGRMRTARLKSFKDPYKTIAVYQRRIMGSGKWSHASIQWSQELTATPDEAALFIEALQEAVRIYRDWDRQSEKL